MNPFSNSFYFIGKISETKLIKLINNLMIFWKVLIAQSEIK